MTAEEEEQLERLIGSRNPVTVYECRPVPVNMVPSLVRERFRSGVNIEVAANGAMSVTLRDGTIFCVSPGS